MTAAYRPAVPLSTEMTPDPFISVPLFPSYFRPLYFSLQFLFQFFISVFDGSLPAGRSLVNRNDSRPLYFRQRLGMRDGQPAEEIGDLALLAASRPDDEVPVIAHEDIGQHAQRDAGMSLGQHLLKGREIGILLEQPQPTIGSIEHMIRVTTHQRPGTPWHDGSLPSGRPLVNRNDSRPLYFGSFTSDRLGISVPLFPSYFRPLYFSLQFLFQFFISVFDGSLPSGRSLVNRNDSRPLYFRPIYFRLFYFRPLCPLCPLWFHSSLR